MRELKKYDVSPIIENEINSSGISDQIEFFFKNGEKLRIVISIIVNNSNKFDVNQMGDILKCIDSTYLADESLIQALTTLTEFTKVDDMQTSMELLNLMVGTLLESGTNLLKNPYIVDDEKAIIADQLDTYRGEVFDFTRDLKKKLTN